MFEKIEELRKRTIKVLEKTKKIQQNMKKKENK